MPPAGKIGSADLGSWGLVGENRQRRFFDEQGLDDGLSRPGRKSGRGDTLTKQRWFRHRGQCWNRQRRRNQQSRQNRQRVLAMGLDGLDSPRLDEKDRRLRHWGSGSPRDSVGRFGSADLCGCRFVGENRQRRLSDEHGLDAGLSRPGRKSRRGDTLTKQRRCSPAWPTWGTGTPCKWTWRFPRR